MVFHVKNIGRHKKLVTKIMVYMFIISTLLIFMAQFAPVYAQDENLSSLTGTVTDEGVDTNGDGYYNYLQIGVEVNITTPGTYTVDAGGLYNANNEYVVVSDNKTLYLEAGIHVVDLELDGTEIYAEGINPTTLASVYLYNSTDDSIDQLYDVELSQAYTFTQFERPTVILEFTKIERKIMLDQTGNLFVTNSYLITNKGFRASEVMFGVPEAAYDFMVRDEMGTIESSVENNIMNVTFRSEVPSGEFETIYVDYYLPWDQVVSQQNGIDYTLQFTFYENFNFTIDKLTASVTLPKGSELQSSSPTSARVTESDMQQTLNFEFSNVTPEQNLSFTINYKYLVFWGSFYPTIWIGLLAIVGTVVYCFWGGPKVASVSQTVQVPSKDLKTFVDTYEEKETVRSELEALEERLQKGKVSRRRYKVRKRMLDGRLSAISRNLSTISEAIRVGGSKYASLLREIEVAEAKLEGAQKDVIRVKARYQRGEISKGAYGKLLEEYESRIHEAEATIDGVLLRLRD
jgi:hypothetical protein